MSLRCIVFDCCTCVVRVCALDKGLALDKKALWSHMRTGFSELNPRVLVVLMFTEANVRDESMWCGLRQAPLFREFLGKLQPHSCLLGF